MTDPLNKSGILLCQNLKFLDPQLSENTEKVLYQKNIIDSKTVFKPAISLLLLFFNNALLFEIIR